MYAELLVRHGCRSGLASTRLLGRILRRAFGLQLLGVEHAIASKRAIGQGLGFVFESVRRRFRSAVDNGQKLIVLYQYEVRRWCQSA